MSEIPQSDVDQVASKLVEQLTTLREQQANAGEPQRRAAFEKALETGLAGRPADTTRRVVSIVRERLIAESRERNTQATKLQSQVKQLEAELASVKAERDSLSFELQKTKNAVSIPPGAPSGPPSESLTLIRDALIKAGKGGQVTAESAGIPASEVRLFKLILELLNFTSASELATNQLIDTFNVGPGEVGLDSMMIKMQKKLVLKRFVACLENEDGSIKALQDALERVKKFMVELNKAYRASIDQGAKALLKELDPMPIADAHRKPIIGLDHAEAWKKIGRAQHDLVSLSSGDMWERFFFGTFRAKLSNYLDSGKS